MDMPLLNLDCICLNHFFLQQYDGCIRNSKDYLQNTLQGSRLTFQLASPVASGRFDPLVKTNFSLARRRHLSPSSEQRFSQTCEPNFLVLLFSSCQ